jgi:hypothetical protein
MSLKILFEIKNGCMVPPLGWSQRFSHFQYSLSHSDQLSDSPVNPVSTPESNGTDPAIVNPARVLNLESSFEQQVLQEGGPASTSSTQPEEHPI